ncbi:hypothetical protein ES705_09989 [subsurface metagenome]
MGIKNFLKALYWKRFNRKYDRMLPYELPVLNAEMADKFGVLEQMQPFKRHFPLPCYKWKKAGKSLEERFGKGRCRDRRPIIKNFFKKWYWHRFNRKYSKYIPIGEIPNLNAGIGDIIGNSVQIESYRRHFPFFGYRWKQAAAAQKKKECCIPY